MDGLVSQPNWNALPLVASYDRQVLAVDEFLPARIHMGLHHWCIEPDRILEILVNQQGNHKNSSAYSILVHSQNASIRQNYYLLPAKIRARIAMTLIYGEQQFNIYDIPPHIWGSTTQKFVTLFIFYFLCDIHHHLFYKGQCSWLMQLYNMSRRNGVHEILQLVLHRKIVTMIISGRLCGGPYHIKKFQCHKM